jgi:putative Holliday junction resolvase
VTPRILGLDPGSQRVGVAVSNLDFTMAFPRPALLRTDDWQGALSRLIDEEDIGRIVIGSPLNLSGQRTPSTDAADDFAAEVQLCCPGVDIGRWDERLTTVEASRSLQNAGLSTREQKSTIDSASATVMLQSYLDAL